MKMGQITLTYICISYFVTDTRKYHPPAGILAPDQDRRTAGRQSEAGS